MEFLRKAIRVGVYSITSTDNVLQADLDAAVVKPDTVMVSSLCQPLHEVLFPDAVYREEESQQQNLIAKLRQVANEIESQLWEISKIDGQIDRQPSVCDTILEARIASSHDAQPSGDVVTLCSDRKLQGLVNFLRS